MRAQAWDTSASLQSEPPARVLTRIAFLFRQYPAASHPCVLAEIAALRTRGLHLEVSSLYPPDRPISQRSRVDAQETRRTHYVHDGRPLRSLGRLLAQLAAHPVKVLRGLMAVVQMRRQHFGGLGLLLFYLAEALLLGRWMKLRRLEHLHISSGLEEATVGLLVAKTWEIPYSVTVSGPEELLNSSLYHLEAKLLQAEFVLCQSNFARSQLYALVPPAEWPKFHVARMGVDPFMLTPPARAISGSTTPRGGALKLVCTSSMVPAKGHRILLEALALLHNRGVQVHTTLIGEGPDLAALRELAEKQNLSPFLTFTGALSHEQTLDHLRRADLFALASFTEGFPLALMEAMSLGLACVGTTVAGVPELLRSGKDGLLVPPANAEALAEALETLIYDPVARRNMGASARQRIIASYNLALNQKVVAEIFQSYLLPDR